MRLLIQHRSEYRYPTPAALGPHLIRLRPADHTRAHIESYGLTVSGDARVHWQQDPQSNRVARVSFRGGQRVDALSLLVEMAVDIRPVNPFDFFVDASAQTLPFEYEPLLLTGLAPYLALDDAAFHIGPKFQAFRASVLDGKAPTGVTVSAVVEAARRVALDVRYVIREEPGVYTPEQCLDAGRGSCRDSAALLVALLRSYGLAARFVSGYLVQLADDGMLPGVPRGMSKDVVDLHAWAEVYLPGAGWIGLDGTSGLLCSEGHIPLACTPTPALAAPIEGTSDTAANAALFETHVMRVGHEVSPTSPYTDDTYARLLACAQVADTALLAAGVTLTTGGEPTFNSRLHPDEPEWQTEALGPTKWTQGEQLTRTLRDRMAPGAAIVQRQGKHYPGEPLPRWALEIVGRADDAPLWPDRTLETSVGVADAARFARALGSALGLDMAPMPAYEDPWRFLQEEARLPVDVDPLESNLNDSDARRRLARVLDRGLGEPVGFVLPVARTSLGWRGSEWAFRRGHLFLLVGDSPIGLRLPLGSLAPGAPPPVPEEPAVLADDPRLAPEASAQVSLRRQQALAGDAPVRTALCIEPRDGALRIFLPPVASAIDFIALISAIDAARVASGLEVALEGYVPPSGGHLKRFAVTPDPGVLEVNISPAASTAEYAATVHTVFDAALTVGLHAEKYLLDGRQQGSGGGNHITLGGPTLLESPFIRRPDLLASLITFAQHHPSLSYLFTGLFVGPTSQAPRVDEARGDTVYELEIALRHAFDAARAGTSVPWLGDLLFRHLLVDVTGNTHRAEIAIDKLCDPGTPHGRQGLVEFRAFEMPPHPRLMVAQVALLRALVATFVRQPYDRPLVRWGARLHDRFLLPYFLEQDLLDVLDHLDRSGVGLPVEAYVPFVELRCPLVGRLAAKDVVIEVRNALEPWNVLGEESTSSGTSRYVDSSLERIEIRARGLIEGRHRLLVNGLDLPMVPAGSDLVAGVRFRAWAPPHALHAHLGIHHPVRIDVLDTWAGRSLGACAYHVWHPEGRAFEHAPLTRFEASARRAQRFTMSAGLGHSATRALEAPTTWPASGRAAPPNPEAPCSLDLRRFPVDRPVPEPDPADEP